MPGLRTGYPRLWSSGSAVSNLTSMRITPDGKDVVLATVYQEIYQVSGLSAAGSYPAPERPNAVSIADDGTVAAGTCCEYLADGSPSNGRRFVLANEGVRQ